MSNDPIIEAAMQDIKAGKQMSELKRNHPEFMRRYSAAAKRCIPLYWKRRNWKTEVFVLIGKGEAFQRAQQKAAEMAPNAYIHDGGKWFDGYEQHEDVIVDNFKGKMMLSTFLGILDRYPFSVPIRKSAPVNWAPKRIFVISEKQPEEWYPKENADRQEAIRRRLDYIEVL
jgi:hypothetical protein